MTKLKEKDIEILDFIYERITNDGYPPTVREICKAVNLSSPATIQARLNRLEREGYIKRTSMKNRSMQLINYTPKGVSEMKATQEEYVDIPIYGKITAGVPITAIDEVEGHFPMSASYVSGRELFMLKVHGESMVNAAILDGDYIIVEKKQTAENGEIVAALTDENEATVKTFYRENGVYRLQPENDFMEPIICKSVEILGKVVGIFRMI